MRVKWTDRRFNFDFPAGIYPEMIERIRGTPARLEDLLAGLLPDTLTAQFDGRWSMQENAGHLLDLESLVSQRIDEYVAGNLTLHAADMSNRKTHDANYTKSRLTRSSKHFARRDTKLFAGWRVSTARFLSARRFTRD